MSLLMCMILFVSLIPDYVSIPCPDAVILLTYAVISFLRSLARYGARAYLRSGFEHPTSTLPTRFPAALGIRHG